MEIKRKIYQKLLDWKNKAQGKKAILIEGARRIGKTTVAEKFAKSEYKSYILIDFNNASKKIKNSFEHLSDM
ncbi:MAG: AAA family ATPase, partial [Spirochaetia bacterium]|nr:AAA family ATPase [Spirochaetia bacterium]MBQ3713779.1 AAA family ATPase [Spirochaetia bacterium]